MFKINIEKKTLSNKYFRKVLYTNKFQQLVVMNLLPFQEIGNEKHKVSQFFRIEEGYGYVIIDNKKMKIKEGFSIIINPNTYHNIIAGKYGIKLYTIYSTPIHSKKCSQLLKEEKEC